MLLSLITCQTQESHGKAGLMEPGSTEGLIHPKYVKYWKNANMSVSRLRNTTAGSVQSIGDVKAMSTFEYNSNVVLFFLKRVKLKMHCSK